MSITAIFPKKQDYKIYALGKPEQVGNVEDGVDAGCFADGIKMEKI